MELKKLLILQKMELSYIFSKESCSYISGNGTPPPPPKRNVMFQETKLSYASGNV